MARPKMQAGRSVNLYLPEKLIDEAREVASSENRSMSQLIGDLIRRRVSTTPRRRRVNASVHPFPGTPPEN